MHMVMQTSRQSALGKGQAGSCSHEASHHSSLLWCLDISTQSFCNRWSPSQTKKEVPKPQIPQAHSIMGGGGISRHLRVFATPKENISNLF